MTHVEELMQIYNCSEAEATIRLDMYQAGHRRGKKEGRAEAQRFYQLALGLVEPTMEESALWNNPVPLMSEGK